MFVHWSAAFPFSRLYYIFFPVRSRLNFDKTLPKDNTPFNHETFPLKLVYLRSQKQIPRNITLKDPLFVIVFFFSFFKWNHFYYVSKLFRTMFAHFPTGHYAIRRFLRRNWIVHILLFPFRNNNKKNQLPRFPSIANRGEILQRFFEKPGGKNERFRAASNKLWRM